jgi:hypothetical protein
MSLFKINRNRYGILLIIEVHREEMEFTIQNSSQEILQNLKDKGYYPYGDLDRPSAVN